jgi:hypothetical protein
MTLRLLPLLLVVALPLQAGAYKWYSADGSVHYSDTPHKGAVEITLVKEAPVEQQDQGEGNYSQFEIELPTNEQTLRDAKGEVAVTIIMTPALQEGDVIRYFIDGKALGDDFKSTRITLKNIVIGSHGLKAQIIDSNGNTVKMTPSVRFHMRQAAL